MRVAPVSDVLGAQLLDFDLERPCSPDEQAELRRLFCEHHLLLVRGQDVTAEDQTRFVGYFGPLHVRADGGIDAIISNRGERTLGTGLSELLWHQDGTSSDHPGIATSLWAQEVSPQTAPTQFANAVRALEQLPPELRARIESLHALHLKNAGVEQTDRRYREEELPPDTPPEHVARFEHPIVYEMPHSHDMTILANELMTSHLVELPRDEGEALLQELWSRLYADDNVYVHHWQTNDIVIWDNLALHHCRPEMGTAPRRLRRQSLDGWYTDDGVLDWRETVITYQGPVPAAT